MTLPPLPSSWSSLTWQQLCAVWEAKMRYGGNPDVARAAACLALLELSVSRDSIATTSPLTAETFYPLRSKDGRRFEVTARELSHIARKALPWFDYPYGDAGEKEERDEKGKVIKERREPVSGYVSPMRDAMILSEEGIAVNGLQVLAKSQRKGWWKRIFHSSLFTSHFSLPQVACNNLTWQQYRALQAITPQLFAEDTDEGQVLNLQAQFLAHALVPRSLALLDTSGGSIRFRPHWEYRYNAEQAEGLVTWWERRMKKEKVREAKGNFHSSLFTLHSSLFTLHFSLSTLFHIVFQVYQTAITYYSLAYPLLFEGSKSDPMRDALQGEVGTINTIMKYAGYAEQQQVYDSNLPFVLDILNTMTKEAKEIEKMNSKIKKK